jgi:RimJ/RimL family protein N-acetyltransferase
MRAAGALGVARSGRLVFLRAVVAADYDWIRLLEASGEDLLRYRHRGATVAPEAFPAALWNGVLAQFCVGLRASGATVGVVAAYGADFRNGHAKVARILAPEARRSGAGAEAFLVFFDLLFESFPLRKLYLEVLGPNLAQFASYRRFPVVEDGRLRAHELVGEQAWDLHVLAVHRRDWVAFRRAETLEGRCRALAAALSDAVDAAEAVGAGG